MKIGFTYNLKDPSTKGCDLHAEYETPETVAEIVRVLSRYGEVVPLPCDAGIVSGLLRAHPDLVFNIAEGWGSRDRESFVPALCGMLGIPHTGSDAVALGITMDKALTKRALRDAGVRTADFLLFTAIPSEEPFFGFPAFVKPNCDGSSRGVCRDSLVADLASLQKRVDVILRDYAQPALVEPYLDGRDFCVGLLGNNPPVALNTCEVMLGHESGIPFFSFEYKRRDTDILDMSPLIDPKALHEMENMALTAWDVLGCRDYSRIDFRTDARGVPFLVEVNALPGLSPLSGIFVRQALASGVSFEALIGRILARALAEQKML
ncbi:MAG: D-alanine--D-alanine ligase family protein [Candidatus Latescibacterota bacterium]